METKEKEDEETEGMEVIKENADKGVDQVDKGQEGTEESIENQEDQRRMEIDPQKTKGEEEEQVMRNLLQ